MIRCLKEQIPGAEVHYLTKEQFVPILRENPCIDKIHFISHGGLKEIYSGLIAENFDFIVDLHKNFRSLAVRRKLKKPSATFDKLNFQKWLIVNFKINRLPHVHIVDRYFQAVEPLGVRNDQKGLDYFIPADEEVSLNTLPDYLHGGYIGLVIGAKHNTKIFPVDKMISLLEKAEQPVVLLGGKDDHPRAEEIIQKTSHKIFNACGMFSINQSASLVRQADKIIANDTGLMHIAAAFRKEIISLWGNTIPEFGMYPYMPGVEDQSKIFEVKGLNCRPCSKLGYKKCPKKHFRCMRDIDTDEIASVLKSST